MTSDTLPNLTTTKCLKVMVQSLLWTTLTKLPKDIDYQFYIQEAKNIIKSTGVNHA